MKPAAPASSVLTTVFQHIMWSDPDQDGVSKEILVLIILPTRAFLAPNSEDTPKHRVGGGVQKRMGG